MNVICTENLTKRYGRRTGLAGLDLNVPAGIVFGFLGPNGAGKTTAIRLMLALLRPTSGRVSLFGMNAWREGPAIRKEVGYLPGDLRLYSWLTVRNGLRIVGQTRRRDLMAPGLALAEQFDLDVDVRVRMMSRGMRQKLGLILALAHRPKLLILDEPTSGLDPLMQRLLYRHLRERSSEGATVFFSSHTLSEVEDLCDRVAIVRDGVLVAEESVDALRTRAGRQIRLRWSNGHPTDGTTSPPFLQVEKREGREWQCALSGSMQQFLQWAASQPLDDLTIGPPDLETVFRRFYQREEKQE